MSQKKRNRNGGERKRKQYRHERFDLHFKSPTVVLVLLPLTFIYFSSSLEISSLRTPLGKAILSKSNILHLKYDYISEEGSGQDFSLEFSFTSVAFGSLLSTSTSLKEDRDGRWSTSMWRFLYFIYIVNEN